MEYIMSSIELDQQFIDEQSDNFKSDEEREYWIDLEESQEEEEEVLYEATEDALVNTLFDGLMGMSSKESTSKRRAVKKYQRENSNVVHLADCKWDELANRWGAKRGTK